MNKRGLIVLLVGLNALLLAAIAFTVYTPPSALAQMVGARAGNYLIFGARADVNNDAIYLLDAPNKMIHVFRSTLPRNPVNGATTLRYMSTRSLVRDFAGGPPAQPGAAGQGAGGQP